MSFRLRGGRPRSQPKPRFDTIGDPETPGLAGSDFEEIESWVCFSGIGRRVRLVAIGPVESGNTTFTIPEREALNDAHFPI